MDRMMPSSGMADGAGRIRPYLSADLDDLYRVCVQTAGENATALFRDPLLPGHVFAAPYAIFESSLAWVAEDAGGVAGYVLQGRDSGRRLIETLFAALAANGSRGVHLHVGSANVRAARFYRHIGMTELPGAGGRVFARKLAEPTVATSGA